MDYNVALIIRITFIQERKLLIGLFLLFGFILNAQTSKLIVSEHSEGWILDASNFEALPYVYIKSLKMDRGTVSGPEGWYSIDGVSQDDTLIFSFIGYHEKLIFGKALSFSDTIFLVQKTELLNEVVVMGDNLFLYDLVHRCRKSRSNKWKTAKSYFTLETFIGRQQVEMLECYYNGLYEGYDLKELELKNGRIALSVFDQRYFISLATSKALNMHRLFTNNLYFPDSPFQMTKSRMMKSYKLTQLSKFRDDEGNVIMMIDYYPVNDSSEYFMGQVWIDSAQERIVKVNLNVRNARLHPFLAIWKSDTLKRVDLNLSKTFQHMDGEQMAKSIDFTYDIQYKNREGKFYDVKAKAILVPFDYKSEFFIPVYDISGGYMSDYRKILAAPYNDFFWENMTTFSIDQFHSNHQFFDNSTLLTNKWAQNNTYFSSGFLENPYLEWSSDRIEVVDKLPKGKDYSSYQGMMPSKRYQLESHIYLDINEFNDQRHVLTRAIYDPYLSYYHFPPSKKGSAFVNMYFDLIELNRRTLQTEVSNSSLSMDEILEIYNRRLKESTSYVNGFFKEVDRLENKRASEEWNALIKTELGIDNLTEYEIFSE